MKKTVPLTIAALCILYWINTNYFQVSETAIPFFTTISDIDLSKVSKVDVLDREKEEQFSLIQMDGRWIIQKKHINFVASKTRADSIIYFLSQLASDSIVSRKSSEWSRFGVDVQQGLEIHVAQEGAALDAFILGFEAGRIFLRIPSFEEVFLLSPIQLNPSIFSFLSFRNQQLLSFDPEDIIQVSLFKSDTMIIEKDTIGWPALPDVEMNRLLPELSTIQSTNFADDFDEMEGDRAVHKIELLSQNGKTITLSCFTDSLSEYPYIFHSSTNPGNWFYSDSTKIFSDLVSIFEMN